MVVSRLTGEQEGSVAGEALGHSPLWMRRHLACQCIIDGLENGVCGCYGSRNQQRQRRQSELADLSSEAQA
jgi:hypothetical protein